MIRRLTIPLVLVALGTLPATAHAGTYTVRACFPDGINNSWQAARYSAYADAYTACPAGAFVGGRENEGMVARNTGGPGRAPGYAGAEMFFSAPPGARIVKLAAHVKQTSTGGWQAGIRDGATNRWIWCGVGCNGTFGIWAPFDFPVSTTRISAMTVCGATTCARDGLHGYMALRDVSVVVADDGPPSVGISGGTIFGGWRRGVQDVRVESSDPVGVRRIAAAVDGVPKREIDHQCNDTLAAPCPNGTDSLQVDTQTVADGRHTLSLQVTDSAGNTSTVSRTALVDNTAPSAPIGLVSEAGTGWRAQNSFGLRWTNPRQTASPIAGAKIAICPSSQVDPVRCPAVYRSGRELTKVEGLTVPGLGRWLAYVWLRDAAGNEAAGYSAQATLRLDDQPPTLAIRPSDPDRPAVVRVAATDRGSGLGTREILLRRKGQPTWISLPITAQRDGFSGLIDDEALPDGRYELRARAADLAGNERSNDRRTDGKPAELALPLRIKTRLAVGRPTRVRARGAGGKRRYRIKLIESPQARYGRTIPLRGRLTSPGGNPLTGREISVLEHTHLAASPWRLIATLRTSRTGRFKFKALRGPSRTLRFRFGGSDTIRGRTADVRLGVRASTTLHVSRRQVVNGEAVSFRGRLRGRPIPAAGKLVIMQVYARGDWLTFGTARAHASTGRWTHDYRFSATRGNVRYRFRARIPRETGHPYEPGVSRSVVVRVKGL